MKHPLLRSALGILERVGWSLGSPPPNGELHLQRGGWVNTLSGFFSRESGPAFTFNAGTSGTRNEYVGSTALFVPLSRRLQIGLLVPFVDSLQGNDTLPSAT